MRFLRDFKYRLSTICRKKDVTQDPVLLRLVAYYSILEINIVLPSNRSFAGRSSFFEPKTLIQKSGKFNSMYSGA